MPGQLNLTTSQPLSLEYIFLKDFDGSFSEQLTLASGLLFNDAWSHVAIDDVVIVVVVVVVDVVVVVVVAAAAALKRRWTKE